VSGEIPPKKVSFPIPPSTAFSESGQIENIVRPKGLGEQGFGLFGTSVEYRIDHIGEIKRDILKHPEIVAVPFAFNDSLHRSAAGKRQPGPKDLKTEIGEFPRALYQPDILIDLAVNRQENIVDQLVVYVEVRIECRVQLREIDIDETGENCHDRPAFFPTFPNGMPDVNTIGSSRG
jgi:hypothetical protein